MTEPLSLELLLERGLGDLLNPGDSRKTLARRLPEAVRDHVIRSRWIDTDTRSKWSGVLIDKLWREVDQERSGRWDRGWAELVAGLAIAIELVNGDLPHPIAAELRDSPAETIWRTMRTEHQRFALLIDADVHVRRVFACASTRPLETPIEEALRWGHDGPEFRDRSHTLLLALMADGLLPPDLGPVAASGVLEPGTDTILPVLGLDRKAAAWWSRHPDGLLITGPVAHDTPETWVAVTRALEAGDPPSAAWLSGTSLAEVTAKLAARPTSDLPLAESLSADESTTGPLGEVLLDAAWAAHQEALTGGPRRGLVIRGSPGAGKTTLAESLAQRFVSGPLGALGLGVHLRARDLSTKLSGSRVPSWAALLEGLVPLKKDLLERLVTQRRLVPIIDDWDQLAPTAQRALRELLTAAPSWWIATTRGPRAEAVLPSARWLELAPQPVETFTADDLDLVLARSLAEHRITDGDARLLRRVSRRALGDLALTCPDTPIDDPTLRRVVTVADFTNAELPALEQALDQFGYLLTHENDRWQFPNEAVRAWAVDTALAARAAREAPYRKALAETCRSMSVFGLPHKGLHSDQDVLFVAPQLWSLGEGEPVTLDDLVAGLHQEATPIVILGDPGAGKTTVSRYIARTLAKTPNGSLPVWLPLRSTADSTRPLLQHIAELADPSGPELTRAELDAALMAGRATLILDGLDEVNESRRATILDELRAVRTRYPRAALLVTCRPQSYPWGALEGYRELVLGALTTEARDELLQRWCRLIYPDSEDARDQAFRSIMAGIATLSRSRTALGIEVFVHRPLFVAMFALAWRADEHLPTSRWEALDRCLRTMLFTWTRTRAVRFDRLDPDHQLAALELTAWHIHEAETLTTLELERPRLVDLTCKSFETLGLGPDRRQLAEDWITYLTESVGLLEEVAPSKLVFVHRVLLEALAAEGLRRVHGDDAVRVVLERDRRLEEQIYELFFERRFSKPPLSPVFDAALASLRDRPYRPTEAMAWRDDTTPTLDLGPAAGLLFKLALHGALASESQAHEVFEAIAVACRRLHEAIDGAARHTPWGDKSRIKELWQRLATERPELADRWRSWLRKTLMGGLGDTLLGAILWAKNIATDVTYEPCLEARSDGPRAAADCVELWPDGTVCWEETAPDEQGRTFHIEGGQRVRRWVARRVPADVALSRLDRWPDADLFDLACVAMHSGVGEAMAAALATRVAETALRLGSVSPEGVNLLMDSARRRARGNDDFIAMRRGNPAIMVYPRRPPLETTRPGTPGQTPRFHHELMTLLAEDRQEAFGSPVARPPSHLPPLMPEPSPREIAPELLQTFIDHVGAEHFDHTFPWRELRTLVMVEAGSYYPFRPWPGEGPIQPTAVPLVRGKGRTPPPTSKLRESRFIFAGLRGEGDEALAYLPILKGVHLGEHLVFALDRADLTPLDRLGAYRHRMRSRLALEVWPYVDQSARKGGLAPDRPALAALYLALGWSQHTTTGQWPETRRWTDCFKGTPQHWLVRAHWHLAWLAHDPADGSHLKGLRATLKLGSRDRDLAPIAERMSQWRRAP